jgi:hypothetical protein
LAIELHVRRLVCPVVECPQRTFRQQVPELALRYARRTLRMTTIVGRVAIALAGRAGASVLAGLGVPISRSTVLRVLMALPIRRPRGRRCSASMMSRCGADAATRPC